MSAKTKQSKTPKQSKAEPVEQVEQAEPIEFDAAVDMGRHFVALIELNEELGALADRVKPKYGKQTVAKLAEAIGLTYDTLKKYRTVYRAYKDKQKEMGETSPPFAVLSALAAVPERADIIKANPDLTTAVARGIAQAHKANTTATNGQPKERWIVTETRRWFDDAMEAARKTFKFGHPPQERLDPDVLRAALADPDQTVAVLRKSANANTTLADAIEDALANGTAPSRPEPMFEGATPEAARASV